MALAVVEDLDHREQVQAGDGWPPLTAGLFGPVHAYQMADQALRRYTKQVQQARRP